jgi:Leucine-rich repeat (LRR) protein
MQGTLPSSLGNLGQLESLGLFDNRFSGTLPETIGRLTELREMVLAHNEFSGIVPFSIAKLEKLELCHLMNNDFSDYLAMQMLAESNLDLDTDYKPINSNSIKSNRVLVETKLEDEQEEIEND